MTKRITEKTLRSQERHIQAGLHEAGLKLWVSVVSGTEGGAKECVVWSRPLHAEQEEKQELFRGSVRETWVFLEGWRTLRPLYKAGMYSKLAKIFGVNV